MFCGNCGQKLADGAKFCPTCGSPVAGSAPAPAPAPEPVYTPAPAGDSGPYSSTTPGQAPQDFSYQTNSNPFGAPVPAGPQGGGPFVPVQADRSLPMWIILSIVTCGIYSWYFLYELARDMNVMCQNDGETTPGLAQFILLSIVTCGFYAYWWYYKIGNRMQTNAPRYGLQF